MNKLLLTACASAGLITASSAATVLVNYHESTPTTATSASYQANHAEVELSATVVGIGSNAGAQTGVAGVDISIDISDGGRAFTAGGGPFVGTAITDSYLAARNVDNLELTISSLEELQAGTTFKLVVYAVGDNGGQDGNTTVTYNGTAIGPIFTEADGSGTAFGTYEFTKADGVDSLLIQNAGNGNSSWRGINGFSLTGTAVPEPSSTLLIGLAGFGAILRRRR